MSKMVKSITLKELRRRNLLKKGTWFAFPIDPDEKVTLTSKHTGVDEKQVFSNNGRTYHLFRYAGESTFDIFEFKGEPIRQEIKLFGKQGFFQGADAMNTVCDGLINSMNHGVTTYALTEDDFRELPNYLKYLMDGDCLLSGKRINAEGGHLIIPAVRNGELTYKTLYCQGSGEFGICGAVIPKALITAGDSRVQVIIDDTPERGSTREIPYEIIFTDDEPEVQIKECPVNSYKPEENVSFNKKALEQVIASMEEEIRVMKKAIRHAEINLSGLKEIAKTLK